MKTIEKALNRLQWRFKNENVKINESKITINELDQKAVDFLTEWIERQKRESLQQNLLFAKIYTYALKNELIYFKHISPSTRTLQEKLEMPIEYHYSQITEILNMIEIDDFAKKNGICQKNINFRTNAENIENKKIISENIEKMKKVGFGFWTDKQVFSSLNNEISELINKYKNKK
jgi:hypothetical protein